MREGGHMEFADKALGQFPQLTYTCFVSAISLSHNHSLGIQKDDIPPLNFAFI